MKLKIECDDRDLQGLTLPTWYGVAYRRYEIRRTVLYLIPLNPIVRYGQRIYWRCYRFIKHDGWQDKLEEEYQRGWREGREKSEQHYENFKEIIKEACRAVNK